MNTTDRPTGRHQINIGHLVMGLALLGIVGVWALVQTDTVKGDDIRWLMPVPWVLAGVVGLAATAVTGSRRHAVRQAGWVGAEQAEPEAETEDEPRTEALVEETAPLTAQNDQNDPEETS